MADGNCFRKTDAVNLDHGHQIEAEHGQIGNIFTVENLRPEAGVDTAQAAQTAVAEPVAMQGGDGNRLAVTDNDHLNQALTIQ